MAKNRNSKQRPIPDSLWLRRFMQGMGDAIVEASRYPTNALEAYCCKDAAAWPKDKIDQRYVYHYMEPPELKDLRRIRSQGKLACLKLLPAVHQRTVLRFRIVFRIDPINGGYHIKLFVGLCQEGSLPPPREPLDIRWLRGSP